MEKLKKYSEGNSYALIHNEKEDDYSEKSFYLRTGKSIDDIISRSKEEFGKDANFEVNNGEFLIDKNKIVITPKYSLPFTHLVTEGIFYNELRESIDVAQTIRTSTRNFFESNNGFVTNIKSAEEGLLDILTDPENPAIVRIPGINPYRDFMRDIEYDKLSRGFLKYRRAAMNYGYIFGKNATFIVDGEETADDSDWYILPNSKENILNIKRDFSCNVKVGFISRSNNFTFSEADKVSKEFYFDGTTRDLVGGLMENGINLTKGLSLKDFSNK